MCVLAFGLRLIGRDRVLPCQRTSGFLPRLLSTFEGQPICRNHIVVALKCGSISLNAGDDEDRINS